jgi:uncharacterized membrane protein
MPLELPVSLLDAALINAIPSVESCMPFEFVGRDSVCPETPSPSHESGHTVCHLICRMLVPVLAVGVLGTTAASEEPLELPSLPGYSRAATRDLNNRGRVVGLAFAGETGVPRQQAVLWTRRLWRPDTVEALPALPGLVDSEASAISRRGTPVGSSSLDFTLFRAVVWKRGFAGEWEAIELEPPPGLTDAFATGVNSRGEIVGFAFNPGEVVGGDVVQRAVVWKRRRDGGYSVFELETPDGFQSRASGINERGEIVGTAFRTEFPGGDRLFRSNVVVWHRTGGRHRCGSRSPVVLAPLPGLPTNRDPAINLRGDVVARADVRIENATTSRPVYWRRNNWWKHHRWNKHDRGYRDPIQLPIPEGSTDASATDINAFGRVVGTASVRQGSMLQSSRPVAWSRGRHGWTVEVLDDSPGLRFVSAIRISDLGHVAGNGFPDSTGATGALLWTPSSLCRWKR